jgi:hypothetical protein
MSTVIFDSSDAVHLIVASLVIARQSYVRQVIRNYPVVCDMLTQSSRCAVCHESFLNTWLECVHFVSLDKVIVCC